MTGLAVPPEDVGALARAIERIVGDDVLAERLGRGARTRQARFAPEPHMAGLATIFAGLVHGARA
ncbi:MAG: hypothetical protein NT062_21190 [Proteobacteria bacterium]|nr:hypothetical protein [Pseudomonadota bacterium]